MTMWQCFTPSNPTIQTHPHNHSLDVDSPSDLPEFLVEETLDSQEEYPQEVVEEAEEEAEEETQEYPLQQLEDQTQGTNSSATCCSHLQETGLNQRCL